MYRTATISEDGRYRYELYRDWREDVWEPLRVLVFVMLNPSTADGKKDDPTVRKCIGFAKVNGYNAIRIVNLFAFRATDPKQLLLNAGGFVVGPDNDSYIARLLDEDTVVAAWGSFPYPHNWMHKRVERTIQLLNRKLWCVRKSGSSPVFRPWHPLYVPYGPLIEF